MTELSGVKIGDEHIALLREFLCGDTEEPVGYGESITDNDVVAHNLLSYSAFAVAVLRKFSPTYSVPEIIKYVAELRKVVVDEESLHINPRVAEGMIREVLQDKTLKDAAPFGADDEAVARAGFLVLLDFFHNADLDGPALEEFLQESADYARWLLAAQQARQTVG
ncbi:hypothetical protein [Actinomadura chibensis]|uniref:Uncharacterized protein n=1 Tax=Actinomadura chibensis TaxID=392828 RepID=A0A5D0NQP2_9ACTN|nr:hypothetical protein [Actinomadura chibensis]TYB46629.1 hypothetical protein FXF69_15550 [Actinomadura chibensis]